RSLLQPPHDSRALSALWLVPIINAAFDSRYASYFPETKVRPESVLDVHGIARRQRARWVLSLHLDGIEARAGRRRLQCSRHFLDARHVAQHARFRESRSEERRV